MLRNHFANSIAPHLLRPVVMSQPYYTAVDGIATVIDGSPTVQGECRVAFGSAEERGFIHLARPAETYFYGMFSRGGNLAFAVPTTGGSVELLANLVLTDFAVESLTWANQADLEYHGELLIAEPQLSDGPGEGATLREDGAVSLYLGRVSVPTGKKCYGFRLYGDDPAGIISGMTAEFFIPAAILADKPDLYESL